MGSQDSFPPPVPGAPLPVPPPLPADAGASKWSIYDDPQRLGTALIILFGLMLPLDGALIVDSFFERQINLGNVLGGDNEDLYYLAVGALGLVTVLLAVAIMIVWLVWMRRTYRNLEALGVEQPYSPGWVIGGWIVPIASLYIPLRITDRTAVDEDPHVRRSSTLAVVGIWWALFLVSQTLSVIALAVADPRLLIVSAVFDVAAGLAALAVIRRVGRGQEVRRAAMTATLPNLRGSSRINLPLTMGAITVAAALIGWVSYGLASSLVFEKTVAAGGSLTTLVDMAPGDCFDSTAGTAVRVATCQGPHDGQLIANFTLIDDGPYPDEEALFDFVIGRCWEEFERQTGRNNLPVGSELFFDHPTAETWFDGDRKAVCMAVAQDVPLHGTMVHPQPYVRFADTEPGTCYQWFDGYATLRRTMCPGGDFRVHAVVPLEGGIDSSMPSQATIDALTDEHCPSNTEPLPPTDESWRYGDRALVCVEWSEDFKLSS